MWRALITLSMLIVVLSGCASHYYRVENQQVSLYLKKPEATEAALACSLDGYRARPATLASGRWLVTLPGDQAFRYFYVVDGQPYTPDCRFREKDDFGAQNCIFDPDM